MFASVLLPKKYAERFTGYHCHEFDVPILDLPNAKIPVRSLLDGAYSTGCFTDSGVMVVSLLARTFPPSANTNT